MRHVLTNSKVAEAFIAQDKEYARSNNGNFSFQGKSCYSYCTEIARWVTSPTGKKVLFVTTDRYSVTTSGHINSISWKNKSGSFNVPFGDLSSQAITQYYLSNMRQSWLDFDNARIHARWFIDRNHRIYKELKRYCLAFNVPVPSVYGLWLNPDYKWIKRRFWKVNKREIFLPKWFAKVREQLDFDDSKLNPKLLYKVKNAEIRREIIAVIGIERICFALNAQIIDQQDNYQLVLLDLKDGRNRPYLKMENPSCPEIWHLEGVHPLCKTVRDAINYRRFGRDMVKSSGWGRDRKEWFEVPTEQWQPEKLT